jgi:glycosyltransferase involved in cell wall biosynthesis
MVTKVGVVMPVLNQYALALETLDSIRTQYEWKFYLQPNYKDNVGVAAAWNAGTKKALADECTHILILNDDIILASETIDHMVYLMRDKSIGILTGCDHRNTHSPQDVYDMPFPAYVVDIIDAPDFACFMITPDSYLHIGSFDENFSPAYFEDNDYVYRCILSGLKPVRSQNSPFYHYGSRTQNFDQSHPVVPSPIFEKNRDYYVRKWGGLPGKESFQTPFADPGKTWHNW